MRNLFFILSFNFVFCVSMFAQENSPCPKISVFISPKTIISGGDIFTFTAYLNTKLSKLNYHWSLSSGSIIEGQDSPVIKVLTLGEIDKETEEIKATVEVIGLPERCKSIASNIGYTITIRDKFIPEYSGEISARTEKTALDEIARMLKEEEKDSKVVFLINITEKESIKALRMRTSNILKYLTKIHKISKDRIEFVATQSDDYRIRAFFVNVDNENSDNLDTSKSWEENLKEIQTERRSKTNRKKQKDN